MVVSVLRLKAAVTRLLHALVLFKDLDHRVLFRSELRVTGRGVDLNNFTVLDWLSVFAFIVCAEFGFAASRGLFLTIPRFNVAERASTRRNSRRAILRLDLVKRMIALSGFKQESTSFEKELLILIVQFSSFRDLVLDAEPLF